MKIDIKQKIIDSVEQTIREHEMFKGVERAVLAFSTGPDSVCLLDVLHSLYSKNIAFHLCYVNHGLRPQSVLLKEEELVRKYAQKYQVRYKIVRVKVKKTKHGLEATARKRRYEVLQKYQMQIKAQCICLGHNLDDRIETFFMNLIRGSGARGLRAMPYWRGVLVRPLMGLKKTDILKYVKGKRLIYSSDETNRRLDFRRNLLRHKIIPQLLDINPELHQTVQREIKLLAIDDDYLEKEAEKAFKSCAKKDFNHVCLDIKKLLHYNPAIQNRLVMNSIKWLLGSLDGLESKHFRAVLGLKDKTSGKRIVLPKKLYAQREYSEIFLGTREPVRSIKITVQAKKDHLVIGNNSIKFRTVTEFDLNKKKRNCEIFDLNDVKLPLFIRNRKDGDYISARIGRKKIKKIFQDHKVPLHKRPESMMLCDQKGILWIFGVARAARAFTTKQSKRILVAEYEYIN